jgi:hypothetical protein
MLLSSRLNAPMMSDPDYSVPVGLERAAAERPPVRRIPAKHRRREVVMCQVNKKRGLFTFLTTHLCEDELPVHLSDVAKQKNKTKPNPSIRQKSLERRILFTFN